MRDMATRKVKAQGSNQSRHEGRTHKHRQLAFEARDEHHAMVRAGAQKHGLSNAAYMRRLLLPAVADDLGIECPEFLSLDGSASLVEQAARSMKMTTKEYAQYAAQQLAQMTSQKALQPAAPPKSPTFAPQQQSGFLSRGQMLPAGVVVRGRGK